MLGRWDKAGGRYIGGQNQLILISKDGKNVAKGNKISNNLYKINLKPGNCGLITHPQSYAAVEPAQSWETWHQQFGHVSYTGLQQMLNKSLVDGFNVDKMTSKPDCRACIESKGSEEPFQKQSKRETVPGELTHIDL